MGLLVFLSGAAVMVLEIIGARFLAKDFGGAFYVWVSQIGVVLAALAAGYYAGGALADRAPRMGVLAGLLLPAGALTWVIPDFSGTVIEALILRHPADEPIPLVWQKLDPALGSVVVFGLPCFALATVSPFMIRVAAPCPGHVGRTSGRLIAASTLGSIAGVGVSGYILLDVMTVSGIFRLTGVLTGFLGAACWGLGRWGPASRRAREAAP